MNSFTAYVRIPITVLYNERLAKPDPNHFPAGFPAGFGSGFARLVPFHLRMQCVYYKEAVRESS